MLVLNHFTSTAAAANSTPSAVFSDYTTDPFLTVAVLQELELTILLNDQSTSSNLAVDGMHRGFYKALAYHFSFALIALGQPCGEPYGLGALRTFSR